MSRPAALHRFTTAAAAREAAGLTRTPPVRGLGAQPALDLSGNDYLGLSRHPQVLAGAAAALARWGAGATGSRLVSGTTALHRDLEESLAHALGAPAALVFASGYAANLAAVSALGGPGVLIVSDRRVHASLIDGCRLSRSRVCVVDDPAAARAALEARSEPDALVLLDTVESATGSLAAVTAWHDAARAGGALLIADEAHAVGVVGPGGRGALATSGLSGEPDVVLTATLSKALGSQGGAVLGAPEVLGHLAQAARTFIFDTALAPPAAGAAAAALRLLVADPGLAEQARDAARSLAAVAAQAGFAPLTPDAAIVAIPVGDPHAATAAQRACADAGVRVGCFRPPAVPPGGSLLRLCARADLGAGDLDRVAGALAHAREAAGPARAPVGAR